MGVAGGPMIYQPEVQHGIAKITMDLETLGPHVEALSLGISPDEQPRWG